jgi:hypothetical protein
MKQKRVAGRFARDRAGGEDEDAALKDQDRAPRPKQCRTFTRAKVAEALPEIVKTFVAEAKKGSIAHTKMLTSLGGLDKNEIPVAKKRRGKSSVQKLLETMSRDPEV